MAPVTSKRGALINSGTALLEGCPLLLICDLVKGNVNVWV